MPQQWEVFYIPNCRHAKPQPKSKFIVIAYINPSPHGFFINSEILNYIRNRPALIECEAPILARHHSFLHHDSYVDCTQIYPYTLAELTDSKGLLNDSAQQTVITAVTKCTVLARIHKKRILGNQS